MKNNSVHGIYFDEISDKIADKFLSYLNFRNISISVLRKKSDLSFLVLQDGKMGRHIDTLGEDGFVTMSVRYSWHISVINPKIDTLLDSEYDDVSLSISKPFFFRGVKIVLEDTNGNIVLSFRATRVILERVTVE